MLKEAPSPPAVEPATAPDHRAQLFSQDQLEAHAARISATHRLADNPRRGRPLLPTLDELWLMYANDEESLRQRIPFPEWVRQFVTRKQTEALVRAGTSP